MSLFDYTDDKTVLGDKFKKYEELKAQLISEGMPNNLAEYKASELLTPDKLEKIRIAVDNSEGRRLGVTFFFDDEEELKLLGKYFHYNLPIKVLSNLRTSPDILTRYSSTARRAGSSPRKRLISSA